MHHQCGQVTPPPEILLPQTTMTSCHTLNRCLLFSSLPHSFSTSYLHSLRASPYYSNSFLPQALFLWCLLENSLVFTGSHNSLYRNRRRASTLSNLTSFANTEYQGSKTIYSLIMDILFHQNSPAFESI